MKTIKIWTSEKIQELRRLINEKSGIDTIALKMGLSESAIKSKCYELKLSRNYNKEHIDWNQQNINTLIKLNDSKMRRPEIANYFGCSISVIHSKLSQLKVPSKNINYFTQEEEEKLKVLFNEGHSINYIAGIINRSSPFLCRKAKEMGLISNKSHLIQEQNALKKEGKRRCYKCKEIYPFTDEYFRAGSLCKRCSAIHRKGRYQSLMNNLTLEQLLDLRCKQAYQRSCKKGWEFNLTAECLVDIYRKQSGLCFYSGIKMEIALKGYSDNNHVLSIDRIDSSRGYLQDNIVLCCDAVNTMKMQMNTEDFLFLCKEIVNHNKL